MLELAQLLFSTFHQTALAVSYGAKFEGEFETDISTLLVSQWSAKKDSIRDRDQAHYRWQCPTVKIKAVGWSETNLSFPAYPRTKFRTVFFSFTKNIHQIANTFATSTEGYLLRLHIWYYIHEIPAPRYFCLKL